MRSANQKQIRSCCSNPALKAIERILQLRRGLPLRRTWIEQPYGEEEITLLEEEVIPAIQQRSCCSAASWRPIVRRWVI